MKPQSEIELLLTDLRADLKRGRHQYWKSHAKQDMEACENISAENAVTREKIELLKWILDEEA